MSFLIITKIERETNSYLLSVLEDADVVLCVFTLWTYAPIPTQCSRVFLLSL